MVFSEWLLSVELANTGKQTRFRIYSQNMIERQLLVMSSLFINRYKYLRLTILLLLVASSPSIQGERSNGSCETYRPGYI